MVTPGRQKDLLDQPNVLTVSQLTQLVKRAIEDHVPAVWVTGEVSNCRPHPESGHIYFSLKDEDSVINCAIWRSRAKSLKFGLENGMEVIAYGYVDVYAAGGKYTFIVEQVEPKGLGILQIKFEQLKKKLAAEGLFDEARKKPIPFLPRTIGLVTSRTGAAVHDVINTILKRWSRPEIYIADVRVQGDGAAEEIADMIRRLNREMPWLDVLIVGRGGGSIEDLWAFNEEVVVRAIAASNIPIISAVGHEVDVTLADFAADRRAKTPTDAATLVVPEWDKLVQQLEDLAGRLETSLRGRVDELFLTLDHLRDSFGFRNTEQIVQLKREQLEDYGQRIVQGLQNACRSVRQRLDKSAGHYLICEPKRIVDIYRQRARLPELERTLSAEIQHRVRQGREKVAALASQLDSLSPLKVLARGYSITKHKGHVVTDASQVPPGSEIETQLQKGTLRSRTI